jgi:hypothetical protein
LLENISLPYSGNTLLIGNGKLIWVFNKYALLVTNAGYRVLAVAIIRKKEHICSWRRKETTHLRRLGGRRNLWA